MNTLLVIDTSSYIHRAYHGYKEAYPIKDINGKPIWVAYGIIRKFHELIDHYKPDLVVSCEDTRDNSYLRRKIYPNYKMNRVGNSEDGISLQFADAAEVIRCMGVTQLAFNGYEADDVIAAVVKRFKAPGLRIIIVTGDKDMSQLVDSKNDVEVHLNNQKGSGKLKYEELITESDVVDKYGVDPIRIPDLFGLIGDSGDGIPGVSGMHENIAKILLDHNHYGTIESLFANIDTLRDEYPGMPASRLKLMLESNREIAFTSKILASPLPLDIPNLTLGSFIVDNNPVPLLTFMKNHGMEHLNPKIGFNCDLQTMQKYMATLNLLNACINTYYSTGMSTISDKMFDEMMEELTQLEKEIGYKSPDSPTTMVGSSKNSFGASVKHDVPMISLDNSYDPENLYKWMKGIQDQYTFPVKFSVEWKWDGISLAVRYEKGILVRAITRGDGIHGDDVTANAKSLLGLPHKVKDKEFTNEVRGEVLIPKGVFNEINYIRKSNNLPEFANPRNASSVIRSGKNPQDIKDRRMEFRAFKLVHSDESNEEDIDTLNYLGFLHTSSILEVVESDLETVMSIIAKYDKEKSIFPYPTDGLVISVVNKQIRSDLGETSKFPRWAKAYKFNPEGGVTALLDVRWQVGRRGTITPVAIIEPIEVSGSVVSKASLHNIDRLTEKNLHYGDLVLVEKAAEIIPQVIKVVSTHEDNTMVSIPDVCPCCGTKLERDGVALMCTNQDCPDKVKAFLEYIASKDILDLKDFGASVIDTLYKRGVRDILGLVDPKTFDGLENEEGYGDTSKSNLLESIDKLRTNGLELYRLIASLGIRLVGKTIGKKLAAINNIDSFLTGVQFGTQIGDKAKGNITVYLSNPDNIIRIRKLLESIPITNTLNVMKTSKLLGKTFCISGQLPTTKDKIERVVRENGGSMLSGVSANLSYLICEDLGNSKPRKAMSIGVPVISYKQFLDLLK